MLVTTSVLRLAGRETRAETHNEDTSCLGIRLSPMFDLVLCDERFQLVETVRQDACASRWTRPSLLAMRHVRWVTRALGVILCVGGLLAWPI